MEGTSDACAVLLKGSSKVFYKIRDLRGMRGLALYTAFKGSTSLPSLSVINLPPLFCLSKRPVISLMIETMAYAFITSFITFSHPLWDRFV